MPVRFTPATTLILSCAVALAGCGGADGGGAGSPSGATCPGGGTTLRYTGGGNGTTEPANFGSTFFGTYCTGCHGPPVPQSGRDFSSYAVIFANRASIDARAAAGPASTNTDMPRLAPFPTAAERTLLGTWIACGAPQN